MTTSSQITVLLVDDHVLVRHGFRRILEDENSITVVGEAGDGIRALTMVRELRPNIVLMDCAMPGGDGFSATREIANSYRESKVVMLSMHSEASWVRRALDAGARGYILKNAIELDLVPMIKRVAAGEITLDPEISRRNISREQKASSLTVRELQVLQLIVDGKSMKEIASLLRLSVNTVAAHRTRISRTLGRRSTAGIVAYAIRHGLVLIP
jgi:DNA-binding NarL/FixJ family response regulator